MAQRRLIDDDVLDAFAVTGDPAQVGRTIRERYGHLYTRVTLGIQNKRRQDEITRGITAAIRG
ncbi:hypothetical protein ACWEFL_22235 [Streptomyces sp. NPDC004838]